MYLTHYGEVTDVPRLAGLFYRQLDAMVELALSLKSAEDRHARLVSGLTRIQYDALAVHGVTLGEKRIAELLALDTELNAQGIGVWLDRRNR